MISAADARVPAVSSLSLTGKGAFTTAAFFGKKIFQGDRHIERLFRHAETIGVETSGLDRADLKSMTESLIELSGFQDGKVRITILDAGPTKLWGGSEAGPSSVLVQTGALPARSAANVGISRYRINSRSPLTGVKSCNYLDPLLAFEDGLKSGYGECLRLNQANVVVSGCLSNVFWKSAAEGIWKTPPLSTGCLEGTTRAYVMESVEVEEVEVSLEEMMADAVSLFLTSSVKGIVPAESLKGAGALEAPDDEVFRLFDRYPTR